MQKLLFFRSLPTPNLARALLEPSGRLVLRFPNSIVLPGDFVNSLGIEIQTMWFDPERPPHEPPGRDVINHCADVDTYPSALLWLDKAAKMGGVKVFNHPREVMKTRRDEISRILQSVAGLRVPRCVSLQANRLDAFPEAHAAHRFSYPVLIRPSASQGGRGLLRIDSEGDWRKILYTDWYRRIFFMTEFVDFRNDAGRFVKFRITNVGQDFLVRHVKVSDLWNVHDENSNATEAEIEHYIRHFEEDPQLKQIVRQIRQLIRLDYWGLDIGYGSGYVFFEGNAAMTMAGKARHVLPGDTAVPGKRLLTTDLLRRHMLSPQSWLSPRETR